VTVSETSLVERHREVVPAKGRWSRRLAAGEQLKIVDTHGRQAVDFLCYGDGLPLDRINIPNTIKLNKSLYISKGCTIYSDHAKPMLTVVEDTCGFHDTLAGCCSCEIDKVRYNVVKTESWHLRRSSPTSISSCGCPSGKTARWSSRKASPAPATTSS
jgi:uncharacterized protein YcgI (DUF1989 family)